MKNKGITLIALVITIIVLIILAGISINLLLGDNGLIIQALNAKNENIKATEKEQIALAFTAVLAGNNKTVEAENLKTELENSGYEGVQVTGSATLKVTMPSGNQYKITQSGVISDVETGENSGLELGINVTLESEEQSVEVDGTKISKLKEGVPIPVGFYYVGGEKNTGVVISDSSADENKGVDAELEGNQFVWVPVLQNQKIKIQIETESEITGIVITDPLLREITTDINGNTITASGTSLETEINPTINGTYTVKVETENAEETFEETLKVSSLYAQDFWMMTEEEMLLDSDTKEEFIAEVEHMAFMIMISEEEYLESEYGTTSMDEAYEIKVQNIFETNIETYVNYVDETVDEYVDSVNAYGGFYIGRFEASTARNYDTSRKW